MRDRKPSAAAIAFLEAALKDPAFRPGVTRYVAPAIIRKRIPAAPMDPHTDPVGFSVKQYAAAHRLSVHTLRSKLRRAGKRPPYTIADVLAILLPPPG